MPGYLWHPMFRQTPDNGSVQVTDMWTAISALNGPHKIGVRWNTDQDRFEDVNRVDRSFVNGFSQLVTMDMYVGGDMADQIYLARVANRLRYEGQGWSNEFTLNGGISWTGARIQDRIEPKAAGGKTQNGAIFQLGIKSGELLDEIPPMNEVLTELQTPDPGVTLLSALPTAGPEWAWHVVVVAGPPDTAYTAVRGFLGDWQWVPYATGS